MEPKVIESVRRFLSDISIECEQVYNEHSLQPELGLYLRSVGYRVHFERPFSVNALSGSTRKPKKELDLLVERDGATFGIELKVPLAGRVPETLYDFCADIEFVEGLIRTKSVMAGCCLLATSNQQFWQPSSNQAPIYGYFRGACIGLTGIIAKPTGNQDSTIFLEGQYQLNDAWTPLINERLMKNARYLLVPVKSAQMPISN